MRSRHVNHGAQALPLVQEIESLIDLVKRQVMRDVLVHLDFLEPPSKREKSTDYGCRNGQI